jgi:hypothetical protein
MFLGDSGSIAGGMMGTVQARGDVLVHVVDGAVVLADDRHEVLDRLLVGLGQVDVAAPDPGTRLLGNVLADGAGLGVVDDDHVPAAGDLGGVESVVALVDLPLLFGERLGGALERVVKPFRGVVELLAAKHHLPLGLHPHVDHQRDERVEDLGDAAPERGGRQVQDLEPLELLGELPDLLDQRPTCQVGVIGQALVAYRYGLEHLANRNPST